MIRIHDQTSRRKFIPSDSQRGSACLRLGLWIREAVYDWLY